MDGIFTRIVEPLDRLPTLPEDMTGIPLIEQRVRKMKFIRTMSNLVIATLLGTLKEIVRTLKGRRTRASNLDFKKWLDKAIEKGAGPVHAYTNRQCALPNVPVFEQDTDGVTHVDPTKCNQLRHDRCSAHWDKRRSHYHDETIAMDRARYKAVQDDSLPCITAVDIRLA